MNIDAQSVPEALSTLRYMMKKRGAAVMTEAWQGVSTANRPDLETRELLNVRVTVPVPEGDLDVLRAACAPNLPWADDHFLERVCGQPLNPPPSWAWWPWAGSANKFRTGEKFNHTYPERYWPKYAERLPQLAPVYGIRGYYGDLHDVVSLLVAQPHTRQAYLPIFFPEDTGVGDGGRKPCTLGYQFILRDQKLHCFYPMRSCDLVRHYSDDVYLTMRLMLWVIEQCASQSEPWRQVTPGSLTMHMTSLHVFVNDLRSL